MALGKMLEPFGWRTVGGNSKSPHYAGGGRLKQFGGVYAGEFGQSLFVDFYGFGEAKCRVLFDDSLEVCDYDFVGIAGLQWWAGAELYHVITFQWMGGAVGAAATWAESLLYHAPGAGSM